MAQQRQHIATIEKITNPKMTSAAAVDKPKAMFTALGYEGTKLMDADNIAILSKLLSTNIKSIVFRQHGIINFCIDRLCVLWPFIIFSTTTR